MNGGGSESATYTESIGSGDVASEEREELPVQVSQEDESSEIFTRNTNESEQGEYVIEPMESLGKELKKYKEQNKRLVAKLKEYKVANMHSEGIKQEE